ncbi:sensor histidine kinase [Hamadaea tsunoensis]|uniref:sensor histidine kinase n=1 Tax=Hamadaea tsunoensis TaxID=53368 RepID=UPI00047F131E|nr:histidine kinase [Hamadaea tsunoensis]
MTLRKDAVLAAGLAVLGVLVTAVVPAGHAYRAVDGWTVLLAALPALALAARQRWPLAVLTLVSATVAVNAAAGFTVAVVQWPVWIALYTCFALRDVPARLIGLGVVGAGVVGYVAFDREVVGPFELSSVAVCVLVAAFAGDATRVRRRLAATRLARELHDAVGHAVNVMVLQAGVARRVFATDPAFAREALEHIEYAGREALSELDGVLHVLTEADAPVGVHLDVEDLVARARAAGRELVVRAEPVALRPGGARALRRILLEAVTNALRHSDSGPIRVDLVQDQGTVRLAVANDLTPGRGLTNMRERAEEAGGALETFVLRASLPAAS